MRYETRIMEKEEAVAFVENMRWFAGFGRITAKRINKTQYSVRATKSAWSNWVN